MQITISDASAMEELAGRIASLVNPAFQIHLQGPLGAGKTTFVRGFLRKLGYTGIVKSPTYTLVEPYAFDGNTPLQVYHFDLYRLNSPEELEEIGLRDYLERSALCLIEWPEKAQDLLGLADLSVCINLSEKSLNERYMHLSANTASGELVLRTLQDTGNLSTG